MSIDCIFCVGHGVVMAGKDAKAFIKHGSLNIEINEDAKCLYLDDFDDNGNEIFEVQIDEIILPINFCPMCGKELKS